jgi:predicted phosphodiesterase
MRIAIISDIHEDIVSLRLAIQKIQKAEIDKIVCLGDIAGFNPKYYQYLDKRDAHLCLEVIHKHCEIIIPGNHDYFATEQIPEISPNFYFPENWYDLDYFEKKRIGKNKLWMYEDDNMHARLSHQDVNTISDLNQFEILEIDGIRILFSHYLYPNLSGLETVFYSDIQDFSPHFNFMTEHRCNISIHGHSHRPGIDLITEGKKILSGFSKRVVSDFPSVISCPPIANGTNQNGYLEFDTITFQVKANRF